MKGDAGRDSGCALGSIRNRSHPCRESYCFLHRTGTQIRISIGSGTEPNQYQIMNEQCCESGPIKRYPVRAVRNWLWEHLVGKPYRCHLYRHVMRFAHRHNWHYAPPNMLQDDPVKVHHWCQWCGLRGDTIKYDPDQPLIHSGAVNDNSMS